MGPAPGYSHWNYRIVEDEEGGYAIHEVYYDDMGVVTDWSEKGVGPYGETMRELNTDFNMMQEAFYENVLKFINGGEDGPRLDEHSVYTKRTEVEHDTAN